MALEEDLTILDRKLMQLKLAYDQYFLGARPREPVMLRDEVQKAVVVLSNQPIQNTALRFRFGSIMSRYQAYKRRWVDTLRKIEDGTYERHQFKARIHKQGPAPSEGPAPPPRDRATLFEAYVEARRACGQPVASLSPEKLDAVIAKQEGELRERYGSANVRFKVVVEDGKAKLKASRAQQE